LRRYSSDIVGNPSHPPSASLVRPKISGNARITFGSRYDNTYALHQIEEGHNSILSRAPATDANKKGPAKNGKTLPRVITLGGDHTITLPLLRSINRAYGPISVIHFDSHLDTWRPKVFGGSPSKVASINHGTYFYHAAQEGLLANDSNIHAGIRTTLSGPSDYENDGYCGFEIVEAREIDTIGMDGIIKKIKDRVGTTKPVYLSLDIDTLDPACKSLSPRIASIRPSLISASSRSRNWDTGNRGLVNPRATYDSPWPGRH
jgi:arginase family enzyme